MRKDNGALAAIGITAALAALAAWGKRGSPNDDLVPDDLLQRSLVRGDRRRAMLPQPALPDREMLRLALTGGDPLGGMSLAEAAKDDPRRIIAMVDQMVMPAFLAPMMGGMPQAGGHLQIPGEMLGSVIAGESAMWQAVRDLTDGNPDVKAWTTMVSENIGHTLERTAQTLPPGAHRMYLDHIDTFREVFNAAGRMVDEVARTVGDFDDRLDWAALAGSLYAYPDTMREVFMRAVQGRLAGPGGQHELPGRGRGMLGGRNRMRGSRS